MIILQIQDQGKDKMAKVNLPAGQTLSGRIGNTIYSMVNGVCISRAFNPEQIRNYHPARSGISLFGRDDDKALILKPKKHSAKRRKNAEKIC